MGNGSNLFPCKSIGKVKAPWKVAFFTWTTAKGKILTLDNLSKRNICIVNRYCMCKSDGESVDHLLFHCSYAYNLWSFVFNLVVFLGLCLTGWLTC